MPPDIAIESVCVFARNALTAYIMSVSAAALVDVLPPSQTSLQHDIAINEVTFKEYMVVYNNYYYSRARNVSYPSDWYYAMAR